MAHLVLGGVYLDLVALPLAQQHFERSRAAAEESGSVIFAEQAIALLGRTYLLQGELAAADATLRLTHAEDHSAQPRVQRWIQLMRAHLCSRATSQQWRSTSPTSSSRRPLAPLPGRSCPESGCCAAKP